jgi:hypothetical protein
MTLAARPATGAPPRRRGLLAAAASGDEPTGETRTWVKVLAVVAVASIGVRIPLPQGVTVGELVAVVLLPLWAPAFLRFRGGRILVALGLATLASGVVLLLVHRSTNPASSGDVISSIAVFVSFLTAIGVVLWARGILRPSSIGIAFGIGLVVGIYPLDAQFSSNPWKFSFALPLTVLALALAQRLRRWWVEIAVLLALAAYSAGHDSRSLFGELFFALVIVAVQVPLRRRSPRGSVVRLLVGIAVLAVVVYNVGQALILGGFLGAATQARSIAQIETSGSLILGGRPELAATLALMSHHPAGFGAGVGLTPTQILEAKTGMAEIGYAPNNGYVERYLFGGQVEVHSVFGDLWAAFGIAGLVLSVVVAVLLVWGLVHQVAHRSTSAVGAFLVALSIWFLVFGPFLTSYRAMAVALGLVAIPLVTARRGSPRDARPLAPKEPSWPTSTPTTAPTGAPIPPLPPSSPDGAGSSPSSSPGSSSR